MALPTADPRDAIEVRAQRGQTWREGRYEVWLLEGAVELRQGEVAATSGSAVLWIDRNDAAGDEPSRVLAYLDGAVRIDFERRASPHRATGRAAQSLEDRRWYGRFHTFHEIEVQVQRQADLATRRGVLYELAWQARDAERAVDRSQFVQPLPATRAAAPDQPPLDLPPAFPPPAFPPVADPSGGAFGPPRSPFDEPPAAGAPAAPFGAAPALTPPANSGPFMLPPPVDGPSTVFAPPLPGPPGAPGAAPNAGGGLVPGLGGAAPAFKAGIKKLESRSSGGFNVQTFVGPDGKPAGFLVDSGVRLVLDAIENAQVQGYSIQRIDLETDRIVVWGPVPQLQLGEGGPAVGRGAAEDDRPLEVYLEGNIVFREGDRVIYADRMYYNVTQRYGVVLKGELLTPAPEYQGLLRLKADAIQMLNQQSFQAYGAALTSSRLGVPRYWFQADQITFQDTQRTRVDPFTGLPATDPNTGEAAVDHRYQATSRNNWVYLAGVPVFYWPTIATDLQEPSFYLDRIQVKNDAVFGTQVLLDWDLYQMLGIRNPIPGSRWQLSTDLLTDRGLGLGTLFQYGGDNLFGIPGPYRGTIDAWGINDTGLDNLGIDRRALTFPDELRGRAFAQHRQRFGEGYQLTAEFSAISDRNFLEQYFERRWDQEKDESTGLELKRIVGNRSWSLAADVRMNDFFTQTEQLPRFDHFWLGQSFFGDIFTWYEHSQVGYMHLRTATTPTDPTDAAKFELLPWEVEQEGLRAATRQELDMPIDLGPVKIVPYLLGEAAHWGNDVNGDPMTRLFGQAGVRASLPMWTADNGVQSELFNVNGLSHKVTWNAELLAADSNQSFEDLPLYDPLDDDSVEHFRRRLFFNTFNGVAPGAVPDRFDERLYALRSGLQSSVTSPSTEIADDLTMARLGVHQRWQTKRGLAGRQRIVDWIVFDTGLNLYPNSDRDNFGELLGMIDYDFRWHLGDRLTLLSDGYFDMFDDGLQMLSIGGLISRPERGSLYLGFRTMNGPAPAGSLTPLDSQLLTANFNYRMSEKWVVTGGASYDFGPGGNIGQSASVVRIGESFLIRLGANYDYSRDNFGVALSIEPRFLSSSRLGRVGGVQIPPAGVMGLE